MPAISRLFDFQAGTTIQSSQIDDEFNQLISTINALPDKNGVLQTNLNADLLDGFHAAAAGGDQKIPICDADVLQVALNADLLDGLHASDISSAAFAVGTKLPFYQANVPGGWDLVAAPTDHVFSWKSGAVGGTNVANSWTISGISVAAHTLLEAEIPAHWHDLQNHTHDLASHTHGAGTFEVGLDVGLLSNGTGTSIGYTTDNHTSPYGTTPNVIGTSGAPSVNTSGLPSANFTGNKGGGGSHTHNLTSGGTWRPPQAYFIIGSKA